MLLINVLLWIGQMFGPHGPAHGPLPHGQPFTRGQANTFLSAAMRVETIKDSLQRCLAYPDPPDSDWDRAAVVAYCRYRNQPLITLAQVRQYVERGRASELDKLLARALHDEFNDPDALDRLSFIYYSDFRKPSPALRSLLNEWKRQSPRSAFAYAASGLAYEQAAFDARGTKEVDDTPRENFEDMHTLSGLADTDLRKAVVLNPKLMPAWSAMISLGGADRGYAYGSSAAQRALAVEPFSYEIYSAWIWLEQPNWFGSLADMERIAREAQKHAERNPTLKMLIPLKDFYSIDHCHCDEAVQLPAYVAALKDLAGVHRLEDAADTAFDVKDYPTAAIYYSEVLRFDPGDVGARLNRMYALTDLGFTPWAEREGDGLIARTPADEYAVKARGWAYLTEGDLPRARKDFERATRLAPGDMWAWSKLGNIYVTQHQWEKTWEVSRRLVRDDPKHVDGWLLRADVQAWQPRPGLAQTADYLALRYADDKRIQQYVGLMRAIVEQRAANPGKSNAEILKAVLIEQKTRAKTGVPAKSRARG